MIEKLKKYEKEKFKYSNNLTEYDFLNLKEFKFEKKYIHNCIGHFIILKIVKK